MSACAARYTREVGELHLDLAIEQWVTHECTLVNTHTGPHEGEVAGLLWAWAVSDETPEQYADRVDRLTNDPARIEERKKLPPAFSVPRHREAGA